VKERCLQLILAAWAGSLWTICGIVAPSLFAVLPERQVAGELAGYFFRVATWLGLALGSTALALSILSRHRDKASFGLMAAAAIAPVCSELIIRPLMSAARTSGDMARFGMLHGISALLFGVACVCAAVLVWRAAKPYASGKTIRG